MNQQTTGMGPSMASGNQQCKPNCVDLLNAQIQKKQQQKNDIQKSHAKMAKK